MFAFPNSRNIDLLVALDDVIAINMRSDDHRSALEQTSRNISRRLVLMFAGEPRSMRVSHCAGRQ
jgi:hypothetical protein